MNFHEILKLCFIKINAGFFLQFGIWIPIYIMKLLLKLSFKYFAAFTSPAMIYYDLELSGRVSHQNQKRNKD